jgi:hypothetical protein
MHRATNNVLERFVTALRVRARPRPWTGFLVTEAGGSNISRYPVDLSAP